MAQSKTLSAGNLTKEEFEEILQPSPQQAVGLSEEQEAHYQRLLSEGRIEAGFAYTVGTLLALDAAETRIIRRIDERLACLETLPDQIAEVESIARFSMESEVANIRTSFGDDFPLPTTEVLRVYRKVLTDVYGRLEREFNLQRERMEREDLLAISAESSQSYELTEPERLLAEICPLFRDSTPKIRRGIWNKLSKFTRNQWALFVIETHLSKRDYSSVAHAIDGIVKPLAKTIEKISGRTNIRGVRIVKESKSYRNDLDKVRDVIQILRADALMREVGLLDLTGS